MTIGDGFPNNKTSSGIAVNNLRIGKHDPTVVATEDGVGGLYMMADIAGPKLFEKLDNGLSTNWVQIGGGGFGAPGGANTDVQFNDSGTFGGNALFTFKKVTGEVLMNIAELGSQTQVLGAAGTILSSTSLVLLNPAGNVTTSAVTGIVAGLLVGQILMLTNISANTVTIKNGAGTELPNAIDYVLNPRDVINLVWTGTNWRATSSSTN